MKLDKIRTGNTFDEVWVIPIGQNENHLNVNDIGRIKASSNKGFYYFHTGEKIPFYLQLKDIYFSEEFDLFLNRNGNAHLVQVINSANDESFALKVVFFHSTQEYDNFNILIDEKIEETAKKHNENFNTIDELCAIYNEKCIITDGKYKWFLIKYYFNDNVDNAFSIQGDELSIPVVQEKYNEDIFYIASKIVYSNSYNSNTYILIRSNLTFTDKNKRDKEMAAVLMQEKILSGKSYLSAWDRYTREEHEILFKRARAIGEIKITSFYFDEFGVTCNLKDDIPEELSINDELEWVSEDSIPKFIKDEKMNIDDYFNELDKKYENLKEKEKQESNKNEIDDDKTDSKIDKTFSSKRSYKIAKIGVKSITLEDLDFKPKKDANYCLILSTIGEIVQFKRQMEAKEAIINGNAGIPHLGMLIENDENTDLPYNYEMKKRDRPLSPFVSDKIFKHGPPTLKQKKAIDIALNTPDIAIIQGPPGTGKTTVIAAIIESINEDFDKKKSVRGKILVSGFQHDAVENIVSRLSVNSLPAVKFGIRSGDEDTDSIVDKKIDNWLEKICNSLREKHKPVEGEQELRALFNNYRFNPSVYTIKRILDLVITLPVAIINKDITDKVNKIKDSMIKEDIKIDNKIISDIYALRCEKESFMDDGTRNAIKLFDLIHKSISNEDKEILKKACMWKPQNKLDFLDNLRTLQIKLLKRYAVKNDFIIEKPREDIIDLIESVNKAYFKLKSKSDKKNEIISGFLYELEHNPLGVKDAIEEYNVVFGATTQGSEGKAINKAKLKIFDQENSNNRENDYNKFDTVIIDEAGRASPRDLFIPMVKAKRRVILVGDHRQLPHLIDDAIINKIKDDSKDSENKITEEFDNYIKLSMFEHLKRKLEKISLNGGGERYVVLDEQYRTHPKLGKFVSKHFYDEYNEGYSSPLPESNFIHNLPGIEGVPAVWLHIPNKDGAEIKEDKSWKREKEAEKIAEKIKFWMDSQEGKILTFGIITFYRPQVNVLLKALAKPGIEITEEDPYNRKKLRIKEKYQYLDDKERLRIGTVDAFQGMEFDVVFLSMVRTLKPAKNKITDPEQEGIREFGRLLSPNLQCVSMSRQKKVLIIAGDGDLVQTEICKKKLPAFFDFYDLCRTEGKII